MKCRAKSFTPLFNIREFLPKLDRNGGFDHSFHIRILETIVFPKTHMYKLQEIEGIAEVTTLEYPSEVKLFTSAHFLENGEARKKKNYPSKKQILQRLKDFPKIPYLLGGNTPYPIFIKKQIGGDVFENRHRRLFGIDCSGLLYFVTNGYVPRNTSQLMNFGKKVKSLEPLDLILFTGHVIIYLGGGEVIESREIDGVIISKWSERKKTINTPYKFIRWYH